MLVILNKYINEEVIGELDWQLETIPCSISPIDKLQVRFGVDTDASKSEWGILIEKNPLEYFNQRKALCDRLYEMGQGCKLIRIFMKEFLKNVLPV